MGNPTRITTLLLLLFAIGGIGFAIYEGQQSQRAALTAAEANRTNDEVRRRLQDAEARLQKAERNEQTGLVSPSRARGAGTLYPGGIGDNEKQDRGTPPAAKKTDSTYLTAINPSLRALYLESSEAARDSIFGPILATFKLSPEQMEKLRTLWMSTDVENLNNAVQPEGSNYSPWRESLTQIQNLLGPEQYAAYRQYSRDIGHADDSGLRVQGIVFQLAKKLYASDAPLTAEQGAQLTRMLANNIEREPRQVGLWSAINLETVIAQASAAGFSPTQLTAIRSSAENTRRNRQIDDMIKAVVQRYPGAKRPVLPSPGALPR